MAAAIVLAAGSSRRLGTPKQLVRLGAETLLERTVRIALQAGLSPVLGVLPADLSLAPVPAGMIRVINLEAGEGMASSIRAGLHALATHGTSVAGTVFLACDQPAVTAEHLRALGTRPDEIAASSYSGRNGIPAYFPRTVFPALLTLHGDVGARDLLRDARTVPLLNGDLDVDTIEDLRLARKLYET